MSIVSSTVRSVNAAKKASANAFRTAITLTDADFAALPTPLIVSPSASAGQILMAAARHPDATNDPIPHIRAARQKTLRRLKDARIPLEEASAHADALETLANMIERGATIPSTFPEPFAGAARTVIAGSKSGLCDAASIASSIRDCVAIARKKLDEAKTDYRKYLSTAAIARAKSTAAYLRKFPDIQSQAGADAYDRKSATLTNIHRSRFSPKSKRKGAAK